MPITRARPGLHRGGVLSLRLEDISPNPVQPRRHFDEEALRSSATASAATASSTP